MSWDAFQFYREAKIDYTTKGGKKSSFLFLIMRELALHVPYDTARKEERTAIAVASIESLCDGTHKPRRNIQAGIHRLEESGLLMILPEFGYTLSRKNGKYRQPVNGYYMVDYAKKIGHELDEEEIERAETLRQRDQERGARRGDQLITPSNQDEGGGGVIKRSPLGGDQLITPSTGGGGDQLITLKSIEDKKNKKEIGEIDISPTADAVIPGENGRSLFPSPALAFRTNGKTSSDIAVGSGSDLAAGAGEVEEEKTAKEQRDDLFFTWSAHLKDRWGYELASSAYGRDRKSAKWYVENGYSVETVIEAYDHFRTQWATSGHLHLNAVQAHIGPWIAQRAGQGGAMMATEADREIVEEDVTEIVAEIKAKAKLIEQSKKDRGVRAA